MPKSLVARIRLLYLPIDLIFGILIPLALVNCVEPVDSTYALLVLYGIGLVRTVALMIVFGRVLGPVDRWLASASERPEPRDLRDVDARVRRGPVTLTLWVGSLFATHMIAGILVLLFVDRYHAGIAPRALVSDVLMAAAVFLGAIPLILPMMSLLLSSTARRVFELSHKAQIPLQREPA